MSTRKISWAEQENSRGSQTAAARIERELALAILRDEHRPGTNLPGVRALARDMGVAAPTIQRALDRLESAGLISVRQGSGIRVNDPRECGELSLLPLWFEALEGEPTRASQILGDFLELRRVVATHLVSTRSKQIVTAAPRIAALASELGNRDDLNSVAKADLAFTRAVVESADQFAVATILRTTERLVRSVPYVAEALYEDRTFHKKVIRDITRALGSGGSPAEVAAKLERILAGWDRRTVSRFRDYCISAVAA